IGGKKEILFSSVGGLTMNLMTSEESQKAESVARSLEGEATRSVSAEKFPKFLQTASDAKRTSPYRSPRNLNLRIRRSPHSRSPCGDQGSGRKYDSQAD